MTADVVLLVLAAIVEGDGERFIPRFDRLFFGWPICVGIGVVVRWTGCGVDGVGGWGGKVGAKNEEGENSGGEVVAARGEEEEAGDTAVEW